MLTRRIFLGAVTAVCAASGDDGGWTSLFDGSTLRGWRPGTSEDSWTVVDGTIAAADPQSHLFYVGPVRRGIFRNFELQVACMSSPGGASGILFHTGSKDADFPGKGCKIRIGDRERQKTGSLEGIRNVYKQFVADGDWFRIHLTVRGGNVQVRLNEMLLVDYTPAATSLGEGTFALECKGPAPVRFRSLRVRPLPDEPAVAPAARAREDEIDRKIIQYGRENVPMLDYHVHLKGVLTLEQALAKSRRDGIEYGLAINCGQGFPTDDDDAAARYVDSLRGQPAFVAMQAEGREWVRMFSQRAAARFDYIFTDSMTWTDDRGHRMRLWVPEEVGNIPDPQEFMDLLVRRTVGILEREPIDIYANPTYLPDQLARDYDRLWTEERIAKVVTAAARNRVAIELNDRRHLPRPAIIRAAKAAGCKFTFGSNNSGPEDLGRSEYGLRMIEECGLGWQDFFVPGEWWPRAADRKGDALRRA